MGLGTNENWEWDWGGMKTGNGTGDETVIEYDGSIHNIKLYR